MRHVTLEDVDAVSPPDEEIPEGTMADAVGTVRKLSEPLGTTDVAINHYELAPGESFTVSSHFHAEQEEVFYVERGTVTFETEGEDVAVGAGECLRVPPGTFQLGTNRDDEPAVALALGAPKEYGEGGQFKLACEDCEGYTGHERDVVEAEGEDREVYRCTECGSIFE